MFAQKDFDIDTVLNKPLMAHLSTVANGEPRDSPVSFFKTGPDLASQLEEKG